MRDNRKLSDTGPLLLGHMVGEAFGLSMARQPWRNLRSSTPIPLGGSEMQVDEDHFRHINTLPGPSRITIQQVRSHLSLLFSPDKKVECVSQSSPSAQWLGSCYWLTPAFHNFWPLRTSSIYTAPLSGAVLSYSVLST